MHKLKHFLDFFSFSFPMHFYSCCKENEEQLSIERKRVFEMLDGVTPICRRCLVVERHFN